MNYLDKPKLVTLTNEIHFFNEQGIKVSIEVGKRLEEAKSEFSNSEEWMYWAESEFGYKKSQAYKLVSIAKRFHSSGNILEGKTINEVYALAAFTDEELQAPAQLPSGEEKRPIDMSQREIEQLKREKAEAERRAAQAEATATTAQSSAHHFEKLFNSVKNQPARVETKHIEVVPEHLKREMEKLKFENTNLRHGYQEAKEKLQQHELRNTTEFDAVEAQKQRDKLQHEADISTIQLRVTFKQFVEKAAITSFLQGAIATATPAEKERLAEMVEAAQQIIDQTKLALSGRRLGVVNG